MTDRFRSQNPDGRFPPVSPDRTRDGPLYGYRNSGDVISKEQGFDLTWMVRQDRAPKRPRQARRTRATVAGLTERARCTSALGTAATSRGRTRQPRRRADTAGQGRLSQRLS